MANKYVDFISDKHFLKCIENLHNSYIKAKEGISQKKFYSNKIDTFKLTFDAKFNSITEEAVIKNEIMRQREQCLTKLLLIILVTI